MVHHVQGSMAGGAAGGRAERAAGEVGGGGWPTAGRIDAQRRPAGEGAGDRTRQKANCIFETPSRLFLYSMRYFLLLSVVQVTS